MAIPFKSFRYPERPPGAEHRWGFQFRARDQGQEPGERGLGADVARRPELHGADGRTGRDDGSVHQPQPGDPAVVHGHPVQLDRRSDGRSRQPGHRPRRRRERQVRHHIEPDRRLHRQPRLLADRVGPAADRGQPALSPFLSGTAALLSGGSGDLRVRLAGRPGPHADARRPQRRGEADREGGQHDAGRDGDRRRGAGEARRPERPRLRQETRRWRSAGRATTSTRSRTSGRWSRTASSSTGTTAWGASTASSGWAGPPASTSSHSSRRIGTSRASSAAGRCSEPWSRTRDAICRPGLSGRASTPIFAPASDSSSASTSRWGAPTWGTAGGRSTGSSVGARPSTTSSATPTRAFGKTRRSTPG